MTRPAGLARSKGKEMRDMLIVIVMGVLFFVSFYKAPEKYTPIQSQKIYDMFDKGDTSTEETEQSLAIINLSKMKSEQKQTSAEKVVRIINEQKNKKLIETKKQIKEMVGTIKNEQLVPVPDYQLFHKLVSESKNNFYFTLQQELSGITVNLVSYTPYNNKGILKVKIDNNSNSYFFYSSILLQGTPAQVYGPQFTKTGGSSNLYLLFDPAGKKTFVLSINEQQSKRVFKFDFSIP